MDRPAPVPLDLPAVWTAIDRERLALADLLEDLSVQEWERPSLCDGWRVRDVAAHLVLAHMGARVALVAAARAGGSFDRMICDTARRKAAVAAPRLVAELRAMAGSRRLAPGVSPLEPLLDVLVHGQDIAVPLGRTRVMPVDAAAAAATRVWTLPWPLSRAFRARSRLCGLELVATDVDWSVGRGAELEGPVQSLLMLLTGRTAVGARLTGSGLARDRGALAGRVADRSVVAGIADPASAGGGVPAFDGDDVQTGEVRQDGGRQVLDEVEQGAVARSTVFDPEASKPVGDRRRVGGASRPAAGEQPVVGGSERSCGPCADDHR